MRVYRALGKPRTLVSRAAHAAKAMSSATYARLSACDGLLEGLAQHPQDVAAEVREFIQQEHLMVRPRPFARPRHLAPTDQPHIRDRAMGVATRARGDDGGAIPGAADDSMRRVVSAASARVVAVRIVGR
jgi:hypothetical protein